MKYLSDSFCFYCWFVLVGYISSYILQMWGVLSSTLYSKIFWTYQAWFSIKKSFHLYNYPLTLSVMKLLLMPIWWHCIKQYKKKDELSFFFIQDAIVTRCILFPPWWEENPQAYHVSYNGPLEFFLCFSLLYHSIDEYIKTRVCIEFIYFESF